MRVRSLVVCVVLMGALVSIPWTALADCGSDCARSCSSKTGKDYEDCMVPCLQDCQQNDPPPVPAPSPPTPVEPAKDGGN